MEAGEHISKRLWFHQSYHSAKASPSGESFEKHLLLVIGYWSFSIFYCTLNLVSNSQSKIENNQ